MVWDLVITANLSFENVEAWINSSQSEYKSVSDMVSNYDGSSSVSGSQTSGIPPANDTQYPYAEQ